MHRKESQNYSTCLFLKISISLRSYVLQDGAHVRATTRMWSASASLWLDDDDINLHHAFPSSSSISIHGFPLFFCLPKNQISVSSQKGSIKYILILERQYKIYCTLILTDILSTHLFDHSCNVSRLFLLEVGPKEAHDMVINKTK